MTTDIEIKAGPELDRAVAEVVGEYGNQHPEGVMLPATPIPLCPSTDLSAAFVAAEGVGLFDQYALTCLSGSWRITPAREGLWFADPAIACESTPALAICAAILKLKSD